MPGWTRSIVAAALAAAAVAACRAPAPHPRLADRLIFLGFDGADPDLLEALVAQGKLPALGRLKERGAYGRLESFSPTKSGILWTSVATGKSMLKHGIVDWTYVNKMGLEVPYQDSARRVKTYWEILSERGFRTGTLNWWYSYPPPPVRNGYVVSNAFRHRAKPDTVYPPSLFQRIDGLRTDGTRALEELHRRGVPEWKSEDVTVPLHAAREILDAYRLYAAQDLTVERASDELYRTQPVDVFSTYFRLVDITSHFAVHFVDRRLYDEAVRLEEEGKLGREARARMDAEFARVVEPVYALMDREVAKYMARMDARTALLVASDHGFDFAKGGYAHAHEHMDPPDGVVFYAGPGVCHGCRIPQARLYDIAPTILHALGQPVAADMDGHVLTGALEPASLERHPVRTIASYETGGRARAAAADHPELDEQVLEDLRTLGYIQGGGPSPAPSPASSSSTPR